MEVKKKRAGRASWRDLDRPTNRKGRQSERDKKET